MVFGLLFLAVSLMLLHMLYNQGQLIRHRIQLENASDATAYSIAKLAARNHNFAAYLNRAMVANEVSIGQMSALLSYTKRYANITTYANTFPPYLIPIAPPSPTTLGDLIELFTIPYVTVGNAVANNPVVQTANRAWVAGVSYFNHGLGVFQGLFALSTLVAQFEAHQEIVAANQINPDEPDIYPSFLSFYFLAQNALMTYMGDAFDVAPAINAATNTLVQDDQTAAFANNAVNDYFPGDSMVDINVPAIPDVPSDRIRSILGAYKQYAALVNRHRDPFTLDRFWKPPLPPLLNPPPCVGIPNLPCQDLGAGKYTFVFPLTLTPLEIVFRAKLTPDIKNDGGSAYVAHKGLDKASKIRNLGWASLDATSITLRPIEIGLRITARIPIPFGDPITITIIDKNPLLTIPTAGGVPIAAASQQAVAKLTSAKRNSRDFERGLSRNDGPYGGDPNDDINNGALSFDHFITRGWGNSTPPPIYGGPTNVTATYGGPPVHLSLGTEFRKARRSYEYTVALAIDLDSVETTDSKAFDVGNSDSTPATDWVEGNESNISYDRFDLDTCARAEEASLEGAYQQVVWGSKRPMATLSSAEAYFSNPIQSSSELDKGELASLYSPFWDARLKSTSPVATLIATGEIDYSAIFGSEAPNDAIGITNWAMGKLAEQLLDNTVGAAISNIEDGGLGFADLAGDAFSRASTKMGETTSRVANNINRELTEFAGRVTRDNCADTL